MLRSVILAAARSHQAGRLAQKIPLTRSMAFRCIAGENVEEVVNTTQEVVSGGRYATVDALIAEAATAADAMAARHEYERLILGLSARELTPEAEVSVNLGALGAKVDGDMAYDHAAALCGQASEAGTTVTLSGTDYAGTDAVLETLERLRVDFPTTGIMVQSSLRRTEGDCRDLAATGARIRLCQQIHAEPESVAYQARLDIDRSFVRCLNILFSSGAYAMVATHDSRLIAIAEDRAKWFNRSKDQFEFVMLRDWRESEQERLVAAGYTVRAYLPFGEQWYRFLMCHLADRQSKLDSVVHLVRPRD